MAIAIRRAQEEIRRRRVRRWFAPITTQLLALPPTIEMDPEAREVIVHLYRIIDRLRLKDRTIYVLRYIEGLEQAEIADLVGISVSTVRRRLDRLTKRVNLLMTADPVLAPYLTAEQVQPSRGAAAFGEGDLCGMKPGEAGGSGAQGEDEHRHVLLGRVVRKGLERSQRRIGPAVPPRVYEAVGRTRAAPPVAGAGGGPRGRLRRGRCNRFHPGQP